MFEYRSNSSAEWIFNPFLSIVRVPFAPISVFPSLDYSNSCLFRSIIRVLSARLFVPSARLSVSLPLDYLCTFRSVVRLSSAQLLIRVPSALLFVSFSLNYHVSLSPSRSYVQHSVSFFPCLCITSCLYRSFVSV